MCSMVASLDTYAHTYIYIYICVYIDTHTSLTVRNLIGNMTAIYDWLAAVVEEGMTRERSEQREE